MYTLSDLAPLRTPHGGLAAFQSRYPINFVVKHPNPLLSPKRASPEADETCGPAPEGA